MLFYYFINFFIVTLILLLLFSKTRSHHRFNKSEHKLLHKVKLKLNNNNIQFKQK